jgi:hypothetical protein
VPLKKERLWRPHISGSRGFSPLDFTQLESNIMNHLPPFMD